MLNIVAVLSPSGAELSVVEEIEWSSCSPRERRERVTKTVEELEQKNPQGEVYVLTAMDRASALASHPRLVWEDFDKNKLEL